MANKPLESVGTVSQQYKATLDAKNVFVPKTAARVGRSENLANDVAGLLGATGKAFEAGVQLKEEGIKRLAIDKYNQVSQLINEVDGQSKLDGADYQAGIAAVSEAFSENYVSFDNPENQALFDSIYTNTAKKGLTNITYSLLSKQEERDKNEIFENARHNLYTNPSDLSPELVDTISAEIASIEGEDGFKAYSSHVDALTKEVNNIIATEGAIILLDDKGNPDQKKIDAFINRSFGNYVSLKDGEITWKTEDERIKSSVASALGGVNKGIENVVASKQASVSKGFMDWVRFHSSTDNWMTDEEFYDRAKEIFPNANESDLMKAANHRTTQKNNGVDQIFSQTRGDNWITGYVTDNVKGTTAFKNKANKEVQNLIYNSYNKELPEEKRAEAFENLNQAVNVGNANPLIKNLTEQIAYSPNPEEAIGAMGVLLSTTGGYTAMGRATSGTIADTALLKIAYYKQTGQMPQDENIEMLRNKTYKPSEEVNNLLRRLNSVNIEDRAIISKEVRLLHKAGFDELAEEIVSSYEAGYEPIGDMGNIRLDGAMAELKGNRPVRDENGEVLLTAESYQKHGARFLEDRISNNTMLSPAAKKEMISSGYVLEQDPYSPTSFIVRSTTDVLGQDAIMIDFAELEPWLSTKETEEVDVKSTVKNVFIKSDKMKELYGE